MIEENIKQNKRNIENKEKESDVDKAEKALDLQGEHIKITKELVLLIREYLKRENQLYNLIKKIEETNFNLWNRFLRRVFTPTIFIIIFMIIGPDLLKLAVKMWISLANDWKIAIFTAAVSVISAIIGAKIQLKLIKQKENQEDKNRPW
jgi:magnesium-transporting ATPase (P-type)